MRTNLRWVGASLGLAILIGLAATVGVLTAAEAGGNDLGIGWDGYADGLAEPVDIAFTGVVTDTRMFVVERAGRIKVVLDTGTVLTTPFLDIGSRVNTNGAEMGLLGLAFDPDFANNGAFYVYYSDLSNDLQLSRFQVGADPNVALTTEVKLLHILHPDSKNHHGGDLDFGPDGYLYLAPGDGSIAANAQDLGSLLGKVLRIDVSSQPTYTVPASNPFTQTVGARPEIWAYGLRNPWRFSFDTLTGDMFIGDVGDLQWEEIDRQPAGSAGGHTYGWPCYEGTHTHAGTCLPAEPIVLPIYEYGHSVGQAIVGGYVYRGAAYPSIYGLYFFADYASRHFWVLNPADDAVTDLGQMLVPGANPVTFGQDPAGELYVADISQGKIYRLTGLPPAIYLPMILR